MRVGVRVFSHPLFLLQAIAAVTACAALALWPPSSGQLLLVPVGGQSVGEVAEVALAGGAPLLGTGPFPGSLVVVGERASVAREIKSWNIIIMAAPPAGCGTIGSLS
jgi:hypothetical protein